MKQDSKIKLNAFLNHKGNSTWLHGNYTLKVPLDDTLFVSFSFNYCIVYLFYCTYVLYNYWLHLICSIPNYNVI